MAKRLSPQDWIDFALATLAREGFQALKADILARKLGVSRGSFYWHFAELSDFHARVIQHWRKTATEAIIAELEQYESPERRLDVLLRSAFGTRGLLEVRVRAWADEYREAAKAVHDIDGERSEYIRRLLEEAGVPPPSAATRAQLLYWAYLGAALSRSKLAGERLDQVVAELKRIGFGPRKDATTAERSSRSRDRRIRST
jgi:AcrR family transcriptional regulator